MIPQIFPQGPRSIMGTTLKILIAKSRFRFDGCESSLCSVALRVHGNNKYFLFFYFMSFALKK